jgi:SprT-like family
MTREEWLNAALAELDKLLVSKADCGIPEDCRVSVGFPGGGSARKRIGECWPRARSADKVNEIFINPTLRDPLAMLEVLIHEAIHAIDDCKSGHRAPFKRIASAVGLVGKMTSTTASPELRTELMAIVERLPALAHGALDLSARKKQSTRMLKLACADCGYTVRTTAKWLEVGTPTCCCGGDMVQL